MGLLPSSGGSLLSGPLALLHRCLGMVRAAGEVCKAVNFRKLGKVT